MATKGKNARAEKQIQTTRICVLGPSFVGKTQIVNRLVNNHFCPQYIETDELETYKIFYNGAQTMGSQPNYQQIEILDCFPQDHPLLFQDPEGNPDARKMQEDLKNVIQNEIEKEENETTAVGKKWINAFIFVYDASDSASFQKLLKIIRSVHEFEEAEALGKEEEDSNMRVHKYVIGTKKDLKPSKKVLSEDDMTTLQSYNSNNTISLQEVSSLTAYGIQEVFTSIIDEVVGQVTGSEQQAQEQEEEDDDDDDDYDEEESEEEETKEDPSADSYAAKKAAAQVPQGVDWVSKQITKKPHRHRDENEGAAAATATATADGKKRGKSTTKGKQEEESAAKGLFQYMMPFLFEKEKETAGKKKRGK